MSTYTPIASQTLTANTASIVFAGIPQIYSNLIFIINAGATANEDLGMRFNNDSEAVYTNNVFAGNGTTVSAGSENNATSLACTSNAYIRTTVNNIVKIVIGNYTNASNYKAIQITAGLGASGGGAQEIIGGSYRKIDSINQITFFGKNSGNSFLAGSTFNLYGIVAGGGYANGGDIVTTDGTYWYHTFLSSGAFTPTKALTVDYLVVAGGGGGGRENFQSGSGGGGGAGGLRCTVGATGGGGNLESSLSLTTQSYTIIIGAGGAGYSGSAGTGFNGSNSTFSTITSNGGGGGGGGTSTPTSGLLGGSGGGAASNQGSTTYGLGTNNQGYRGGSGGGGLNNAPAGGGGGAGAVGGNSTSTDGGAGGAGVTTSISGSSITYAGGGGGCSNSNSGAGGAGGSGGGGTGATYLSSNATAGTANTGGGAGGSGNGGSSNASRAGGSGIVIVRYAV